MDKIRFFQRDEMQNLIGKCEIRGNREQKSQKFPTLAFITHYRSSLLICNLFHLFFTHILKKKLSKHLVKNELHLKS
jgi:hypothetical protein